jgi:protein ImuA
MWAAEQVLRSGNCGALRFWPDQVGSGSARYRPVRSHNLRDLHLAARAAETLFFMMSPLAAATDSSPAPLHLSLTPAQGGVNIGFVKWRGPVRDGPLFLPMQVAPVRHTAPQHCPTQTPIATLLSADDTAVAETH